VKDRWSPGDRVADRYRLDRKIGVGSFSTVWRATDETTGQNVALKALHQELPSLQRAGERLAREAELLLTLDHPNIAGAQAFLEADLALVMEHVEGQTLRDITIDRAKGGLAFSLGEVARLGTELLAALEVAHTAGVVHRDLKPANVLLDPDGNPRVTDFGLAKQLDVDSDLTATGQVVGTASYMPPEQAAGRTAQIGPHSDVYSLGAVLYETLTGRPPFQGAGVYETLDAVLHQEPVAPRALNRAIPRDLETICLKCLQKDARRRYPSAGELADDLRRFVDGEPIRARPVTPLETGWRWCRRKPVAAALLAMSLLAVLAAGVGVAYRQQSLYDRQLLASSERGLKLAQELARRNEALAAQSRQLAEVQQYFGLVAKARETVTRRRAGWTADALKDLTEAVRLQPADRDPAEVRSLIAQCLASFDLFPDRATTVTEGFEVGAVAFSPDGRYVAVSQLKSEVAPAVFVYEVETLRKAFEFRFADVAASMRRWLRGDGRYQDGAWSLAFSCDSKLLAAGTRFGQVRCWHLDRSAPARQYTVFEETEAVHGLAFSSDNRRLFASSPTAVKGVLLDGGADGGDPIGLGRSQRGRFAAGGKWLVTFDDEGTQVRDASQPEMPLPLRLPNCAEPAFSPDGGRLAAVETRGEENRRLAIFDVATGSTVRLLADPRDDRPGVARHDPRLTFGADGGLVYGHDEEGRVLAWDAASGELLLTALLDGFRFGRYAVDPRGRYLAFGGRDKAILVPVQRGALVRQVAWQTSAIGSVDLSGDGRSVLCATAQVLRPEFPLTKRLLFTRHALSGTDGVQTTAAFLPFPTLPGNMPYAANGDLTAAPQADLAALAAPLAGVYLWEIEAGRVAPAMGAGSSGQACQFLDEDRLEIRGGVAQVSVVQDAEAVNGRALRIVAGPERCEVHASYAQFAAAADDGDLVFLAVAKVRGGRPGCEWIETASTQPDGTSHRAIPEAMIPRDAYHLFILGWSRADDPPESHGLAVLPGDVEGAEVWIDRLIAVPAGNVEKYKWKDAFGPLAFNRDASRLSGLVTTRQLRHWRMTDLALDSVWDNSAVAAQTGNAYVQALDVGKELALAGGRDGIVRAVVGDRLGHLWPEQSASVVAVQLSSDESWAVVGTQQGGCSLAAVPRGEPLAELAGHNGAVRGLALSADDAWLATGDEEGMLRLWRRSGESFARWLELPFSGPIRALRVTPDRSALAVLVEGETAVRVLDWAELEERLRERELDME